MATTYKKRNRDRMLDGDVREQAVKRLRDEQSIRSKMEILKKSAGTPHVSDSDLKNRPRTHETTRGKRRLSFREAFSRRTTDTSRARVLKLYGRSAPPKGYGGTRSFMPVPSGGGPKPTPMPTRGGGRGSKGDGTYGAALNSIAKQRAMTGMKQAQRNTAMTLAKRRRKAPRMSLGGGSY